MTKLNYLNDTYIMDSSLQNKQNYTQSNGTVDQICLRYAWANYKKYPGSKIMMGPGLGDDTRHFWVIKDDGAILDNTPGYDSYPYYLHGEVLDVDKNRDYLEGLDLLMEE